MTKSKKKGLFYILMGPIAFLFVGLAVRALVLFFPDSSFPPDPHTALQIKPSDIIRLMSGFLAMVAIIVFWVVGFTFLISKEQNGMNEKFLEPPVPPKE